MVLNNQTFHLKKLENKEQTKPKARRRKQTRNMRPYISEIENRKVREKINETESWFFKKVKKKKKIDRLLARQKKNNRDTQIPEIKYEKGGIIPTTRK